MKYIQKIQFLTFLVAVNSYVYCSFTHDLQQREHAVKEFIRQELAKGTPRDDIKKQLYVRSENSLESKNYYQARHLVNVAYKTGQENGCYEGRFRPYDPTQPQCAELTKNYEDALEKQVELLEKLENNTPEYQLSNDFAEYVRIKEQVIPRLEERKETEGLTQQIDKEIKRVTQKAQELEKELGISQEFR